MVDLFCGLGGWASGGLSEGYDVIGFDIEAWPYPGQLVLQDVLTLHGRQFKGASLIVASPPCQAYSYRAMPWKRAKALPPPDNTLFEVCFRIQREASEAAGHSIPLIVENVRGAQKWVGRAKWHYGSYYLWGDVPALMPMGGKLKFANGNNKERYFKNRPVSHWGDKGSLNGIKHGGAWFSGYGGGFGWDHSQMRQHSSKSPARKAASALIAKIPFPLANWIAKVFKPKEAQNLAPQSPVAAPDEQG